MNNLRPMLSLLILWLNVVGIFAALGKCKSEPFLIVCVLSLVYTAYPKLKELINNLTK